MLLQHYKAVQAPSGFDFVKLIHHSLGACNRRTLGEERLECTEMELLAEGRGMPLHFFSFCYPKTIPDQIPSRSLLVSFTHPSSDLFDLFLLAKTLHLALPLLFNSSDTLHSPAPSHSLRRYLPFKMVMTGR